MLFSLLAALRYTFEYQHTDPPKKRYVIRLETL
jgi:hypothetical protein